VSFKTLLAYQKEFEQAMRCFELSKTFPPEERYDLTSQIRRPSRSVCAQIAEGYRKQDYPKHFASKLVDSNSENSETDMWLDFTEACGYATSTDLAAIRELNLEVGRLINYMINNPGKFGVK